MGARSHTPTTRVLPNLSNRGRSCSTPETYALQSHFRFLFPFFFLSSFPPAGIALDFMTFLGPIAWV